MLGALDLLGPDHLCAIEGSISAQGLAGGTKPSADLIAGEPRSQQNLRPHPEGVLQRPLSRLDRPQRERSDTEGAVLVAAPVVLPTPGMLRQEVQTVARLKLHSKVVVDPAQDLEGVGVSGPSDASGSGLALILGAAC